MEIETKATLKEIMSHPHWVSIKSSSKDEMKFVLRGHIPLSKNFKMRRTITVKTSDIQTKRWIEIMASLSHPLVVLNALLGIIPGVLLMGSFLDNSSTLFILSLISAIVLAYAEFHLMELRKSLHLMARSFQILKSPS